MARIRKDRTASILEPKWNIAIYIRLSREDGSEDESKSITEQKKMLSEYVLGYFTNDSYMVFDYYIDDGQTGTDDTRSGFVRMIEDMNQGKINCIICKTLSRAFRNYADQGRYLEEIFPGRCIRFISMSNPHVDSYTDTEAIQNGMEIPINGLMNDRYAAKTSADIRRTFDAKRKRGEFIGGFAPYGYIKDTNNKNKLIPDADAAFVVKDIFEWYVNDGFSHSGIATKLNSLNIPNPTDYKTKVQKLNYRNSNYNVNDGLWSQKTISSILRNEMYIGHMIQGRQRIVSYKVHNAISVPEEEWYRVEDTHEAIIDKEIFNKARELQKRDTRVAASSKKVYLFSGYLKCADCKKALRRRANEKYTYYYCRTRTDKGVCDKNAIREDILYPAILGAVRLQIKMVESMSEIVRRINEKPQKRTASDRLIKQLGITEKEYQRLSMASEGLYVDYKTGILSKNDYLKMKRSFDSQLCKLKESIDLINEEVETLGKGVEISDTYLTAFVKHKDIDALSRGIVVELIDCIYLHKDGSITIDFNFSDELKRIADYIENNQNDTAMMKDGAVS